MEDLVAAEGIFSDRLERQPPDALLALIGMFAADTRSGKIDLGVGVYKDEAGHTPVFKAVKAAERHLEATQPTKSYVGPEGDVAFCRLLAPYILGGELAGDARLCAVQTPGGTGALRLGFDLLARADKSATVHVGTPTWANHPPIIKAVGLSIAKYRHIDLATQQICFDEAIAALGTAKRGDIVLLHGCCHNPVGADFTVEQWKQLAGLMADRGLIPFIDFAYHGLGDGLEQDARGVRIVAAHCPELVIAYSCDKNFGLYRERVGALYVLARDADAAQTVQSNLLALARANWSMPPDHGAAVVHLILDNAEWTASWRAELEEMRVRIASMRARLAELDPQLSFMADQKGMFSTLKLTPEQVKQLREDQAVYMAGSGRINIAGLVPGNIEAFVAAVKAVRD
ncbi:MAG: amino acid aminotransferase [Sphingobium sp.]|nr:aspartate/tyrosine/aromatic aminotransferase [Sphingobium sp.]MCP5399986.1 aspartate/tyrosine/aromatic aminotransferase [Sphingomonas sp.]